MMDLEKIINETVKCRGVILIPAFAVGRAQSLMYFLSQLKKTNRIPNSIPMYLNSPMATDVTKKFFEFKTLHKISELECQELFSGFHFIKTMSESIALNEKKGPMIIIAASGMLTGGRILHLLKTFAPDPKNTIVLAGFQAEGTRGRQIQEGAKEVKIHGNFVPVRAQVRTLENLSAHADYSEIIEWLKASNIHPKKVFITHGEPEASFALKKHLEEELSLNGFIPRQDQEFTLD